MSAGSDRGRGMSLSVYRWLVRTYPAGFRDEYGAAMERAFASRLAAVRASGGRRGVVRFWMLMLLDYAASAPAEWLDRLDAPGYRRDLTSTARRHTLFGMGTDIRIALRQLRRKPGFTAVAVLTIALGVGGNTAMFGVVNAVLLRPLPFDEPDRLVMVWERNLERGWPRFSVSPANYVDWLASADAFDGLAAYAGGFETLIGRGEAKRLATVESWASLFAVLRTRPMLGRGFMPEENRPGADGVVILSHRLWASEFGSDSSIVGRAIELDGHNPVEVVGVLPPDFGFRPEADLWRPLTFPFDVPGSRGAHYLSVVARVKDGLTLEQAGTSMSALAAALERDYPETNDGWSVTLVTLHEQLVGRSRSTLLVLLGAVGLVLLIACVNVANLLLARGTGRRLEMSVRSALGASRLRLTRLVLTESLVLSLLGGGVSVAVSWALLAGLRTWEAGSIPRLDGLSVDPAMLGITLAVTAAAAVIFGLLPAVHAAGTAGRGALRDGARATSGFGRRARSVLLVGEVAMALVLLVGWGLLAQSLRTLVHIDPGFNAEGIVTLRITPPRSRYPGPAQRAAFYDALEERIGSLGGVMAVANTNRLPVSGAIRFGFHVVGSPDRDPSDWPNGIMRAVSPRYFETMGIPVRRGRAFTAVDRADAPPVIVINQALAGQYFRDRDPIGEFMDVSSADDTCPCEIVGVVGDVREHSLEDEPEPGYYLPAAQSVWTTRSVVVRAAGDLMAIAGDIRSVVGSIDADLPVYDVRTGGDLLAGQVAAPRFRALVFGLFAAIATVLAVVGIYGVMSYIVNERTREMGIRAALGAGGPAIVGMVMRQAGRLVIAGLAIGIAVSFAGSRFLETLVHGGARVDPVVLAGVTLVLAAAAGIAAFAPARRAARVDPMAALRRE